MIELKLEDGKYFGPKAARVLYEYADIGEKLLLDALIPYNQMELIAIIGLRLMIDFFGNEKGDESLIDILERQSRCKTWGHLLGVLMLKGHILKGQRRPYTPDGKADRDFIKRVMSLADIPATLVFDADEVLMDYRGYLRIENNGKIVNVIRHKKDYENNYFYRTRLFGQKVAIGTVPNKESYTIDDTILLREFGGNNLLLRASYYSKIDEKLREKWAVSLPEFMAAILFFQEKSGDSNYPLVPRHKDLGDLVSEMDQFGIVFQGKHVRLNKSSCTRILKEIMLGEAELEQIWRKKRSLLLETIFRKPLAAFSDDGISFFIVYVRKLIGPALEHCLAKFIRQNLGDIVGEMFENSLQATLMHIERNTNDCKILRRDFPYDINGNKGDIDFVFLIQSLKTLSLIEAKGYETPYEPIAHEEKVKEEMGDIGTYSTNLPRIGIGDLLPGGLALEEVRVLNVVITSVPCFNMLLDDIPALTIPELEQWIEFMLRTKDTKFENWLKVYKNEIEKEGGEMDKFSMDEEVLIGKLQLHNYIINRILA